ncbi:MAG: type II toxin-antitoxin system PemK/MazF family toxin [Acidobacteria bacterium]|nr:type II toxin-antitoxin system PemK/MazF family toxin [Acidobacteriota bacterium]
MVNRFDVYLINLDERPSNDPKNTRPAVVISPDELNRNVDTVIIAPLASTNALYPTRVAVNFLNSERFVILDQLRTVDSSRLAKKIGTLDAAGKANSLKVLSELFSE